MMNLPICDAIRTEGLTKYYRGHTVRGMENLTLVVPSGETFGFIGPNGAGKSTAIRTLLGLIRADSGSATVLGYDICREKERILAEVGYLSAEVSLYPGMKVEELFQFSAALRTKDRTLRKRYHAEAAHLCDRLGLDPGKRVDTLSLGTRKKAAIVCAFQHRPRLYILDEPTSGLDPLVQREFFDLLAERKGEGATVFFSSHILSEVQHHCDRAAFLSEGSVILSGTMDALSHTNAHRVSLRYNGEAAPDVLKLKTLSGVTDLQLNGDGGTFLYQGEMSALFTCLAALPLVDVRITEPELDEIVLHLYSRDGKNEKNEKSKGVRI